MKKVSVIVTVFNGEKWLKRCIESILNQTYKNLQIIIVDDGSSDSTGKICESYKKMDSRINVIHQVNGGLSNARNRGLKMASGDYIYFCDADDWIEKKCIEFLVNLLENNDIAWCNYRFEYDNTRRSIDQDNSYNFDTVNSVYGLYNLLMYMLGHPDIRNKTWMNVMVWNKLFRGDIIENKKIFFDENAIGIEDMVFTYQYLNAFPADEISGKSTDAVLYHYWQSDESIMGKFRKSFNENFIQLPLYYEKIYYDLETKLGDINDSLLSFWRGRTAYYFHSVLWKLIKSDYQNRSFEIKAQKWIRNNYMYFWKDNLINIRLKVSTFLCAFIYPLWKIIAHII